MSWSVELLPARHGDAIMMRWGPRDDRHRMLVDAGPAVAYRAIGPRLAAEAAAGPLDLMVLTHVDTDHVEGMILLVNDATVGIGIDEVWFNGERHLDPGQLHGVHGEVLSTLIGKRRLGWNTRFGGAAVSSDGFREFPEFVLPGGLKVTVVAPTAATLRALQNTWRKACRDAKLDGTEAAVLAALQARPKLVPADSYLDRPPPPDVRALARSARDPDTSVTNASTIVLLLEYDGQAVLLCGDATPASLLGALRGLLATRELKLTAMTVPHHGSGRNTTAELVRLAPARRYLFSSDGSFHGHPHAAAVATVLEYAPVGAELVFNYATPYSCLWDDRRLRDRYRYDVRFPTSPEGGVLVDLGPPDGG